MCVINLRTDLLTGADTGGSWTLVGGPLGNTVSVPSSGDNPAINMDGEPVGVYTFEYMGGTSPCEDSTQTTYTQLSTGDIVEPAQINMCQDDSIINLFNQFTSSGGGAATLGSDASYSWSGTGTALSGYSANSSSVLDDTFDPSFDAPGTYTFTLTQNMNPGSATLLSCCQDITTFDIVIQIVDTFSAGSGLTTAGC